MYLNSHENVTCYVHMKCYIHMNMFSVSIFKVLSFNGQFAMTGRIWKAVNASLYPQNNTVLLLTRYPAVCTFTYFGNEI